MYIIVEIIRYNESPMLLTGSYFLQFSPFSLIFGPKIKSAKSKRLPLSQHLQTKVKLPNGIS